MDAMRRILILSVAAAALTLSGCGDSPTAPSGSGGVAVRGVLLGEGAAFTASSAGSAAAAKNGPITVVVEGTSITTTISGNGTFELEGLTPGTFTLVFTRDGVELGRFTVTAGDGVEVRIVVKVEDSVVVLVDLELRGDDDDPASKTCLIEGGREGERIELEGNVASGTSAGFQMVAQGNRTRGREVKVLTSGSTNFKCNGKGSTDCKGSVGGGAKVHVRGTLSACTLDNAEIQASEVKVQKAAVGGSS